MSLPVNENLSTLSTHAGFNAQVNVGRAGADAVHGGQGRQGDRSPVPVADRVVERSASPHRDQECLAQYRRT